MRIAKATGSPARAYGGWKCFVHNSLHDGKLGMPFGYLRLDRGAATLIVLPYNYPRLFELLEKLPQTLRETSEDTLLGKLRLKVRPDSLKLSIQAPYLSNMTPL